MVYALVAQTKPGLYLYLKPLKAINDHIGIIPIVLIGDASKQTVRAYRSEGKQFHINENGKLLENNQEWIITENELIGPNNQSLARLPGHIAYWFAWSNYYPDTLATDNTSK